MEKTPLTGMTLEQLRGVAAGCGMPAFKGSQMAQRLYKGRVTEIDQLTGLSVAERERLAEGYCIGREAPTGEARSKDGTVKCLWRGAPGRPVESVWIPDGERATLCVSSQAGCRMGCTFCATGMGGFAGQLTAAQIINQVLSTPGSEEITNIVFMGMGEPLDNIGPLLQAIEVLTAPWGLAMSPKRITVSTVGARPEALMKLLDDTRVHVALSLHLPGAELRRQMMPAERAWPVAKVLEMLRGHDWTGQRRLSIEYVMWRGVNDDDADAERLARMLRGLECRVNLIPYHDTGAEGLRGSSRERMEAFRDRLNALGVTATIRASRGLDIDAACGQLAGKNTRR